MHTVDQHLEFDARPDPARLRYWARLLKLVRDAYPSRPEILSRVTEPARMLEPTRQPAPPRLDD
jgi:hypothetical protein